MSDKLFGVTRAAFVLLISQEFHTKITRTFGSEKTKNTKKRKEGNRGLVKTKLMGYIKIMMPSKTNYFFSFLKGFASAFDITGQTFMDNIPDFSGGFERDAKVLRGDWERVENDLKKAMGQVVHG